MLLPFRAFLYLHKQKMYSYVVPIFYWFDTHLCVCTWVQSLAHALTHTNKNNHRFTRTVTHASKTMLSSGENEPTVTFYSNKKRLCQVKHLLNTVIEAKYKQGEARKKYFRHIFSIYTSAKADSLNNTRVTRVEIQLNHLKVCIVRFVH